MGAVVIARGRRERTAKGRAAMDSLVAAEPAPASKTGPGWDEVRAAQANSQPDQGLVNTRDPDSGLDTASGRGRTTSQTYVAPLNPEPPRTRRPPNN